MDRLVSLHKRLVLKSPSISFFVCLAPCYDLGLFIMSYASRNIFSSNQFRVRQGRISTPHPRSTPGHHTPSYAVPACSSTDVCKCHTPQSIKRKCNDHKMESSFVARQSSRPRQHVRSPPRGGTTYHHTRAPTWTGPPASPATPRLYRCRPLPRARLARHRGSPRRTHSNILPYTPRISLLAPSPFASETIRTPRLLSPIFTLLAKRKKRCREAPRAP